MKHYTAPTPDNLAWPTDAEIQECGLDQEAIIVIWTDQKRSRFHPLWLRDNCACENCLHSVTREHLSDLRDLVMNVRADKISLDHDGALSITWQGESHVSTYNPGWLYAHSGLATEESIEPELWSAKDSSEPLSFSADQGVVSDDLLNQILKTVAKFGLARVRDMGSDKNTLEQFALRIGPVRESHFERIFDVISRADADTNAYTSEPLSAHTDIPTRETPPGLQLLHCLVADAEGGESTMSDGFKVAHDLRLNHPKAFKNLTTTKWCFANRAGPTDYRWNAPIIGLDDDGEVNEVRLLPFSRAPLMTDYDNIEPSYAALKLFMQMANSPDYQMSYQFKAGDLVIFDNRRIMHGRSEFFPATGDRELRGLYIDRDDLYSTIRRYQNELDRHT